jgi:hypothetical protein
VIVVIGGVVLILVMGAALLNFRRWANRRIDTKLILTFIAITSVLFAGTPRPADATPVNTIFDRTVQGCTYEFEYGTIFNVPYATYKHIGTSPVGIVCGMEDVISYWSSPNGQTANATYYVDTGAWHQATGPSGKTGYGANYLLHITVVGDPDCYDNWVLSARFNDGDPEGYWSLHSTVGSVCTG